MFYRAKKLKNLWVGLAPWIPLNLSEPFGFTQTKVSGPSSERIMSPKETKAREQFSFDFHSVSHYIQFCGYIAIAHHVQFLSWFVVYPLYITEVHEYDCSFLHSHVGSVSRPKRNPIAHKVFHVPSFNLRISCDMCLSFFHCFCSWRLLIASHDIHRVQSIGKTNDFNPSSVFQRSTTSTTGHTLQCRDAQQCNGSRSNWTICEFSSQCRRSRSWTCF